MKFGTNVYVLRGSNSIPIADRRFVNAKYVGARGGKVAVKLTVNDDLANTAPTKRGEIGWFGRNSVVLR